jgi:hypothetical protein
VVVDASAVLAEPVLGPELVLGAERYAGPTVFYRRAKPAARDPRVGAHPVRARAQRREGGELRLAARKGAFEAATLAAAREAGALVVIVLGE